MATRGKREKGRVRKERSEEGECAVAGEECMKKGGTGYMKQGHREKRSSRRERMLRQREGVERVRCVDVCVEKETVLCLSHSLLSSIMCGVLTQTRDWGSQTAASAPTASWGTGGTLVRL